MPDWADPATWYDVLNPWGPSDDFYLELVLRADRVLDVGCGTGSLLKQARDAGHNGRLCGIDPDPAMLDQARSRTNVEWVQIDAASAAWDGEFDLAIMSSHAFQVFIGDDDLLRSLRAIRASLTEGGRFVFETRHPLARAWEGWNTSFEARNPDGDVVRVSYHLQEVIGDVVRFTETLSGKWWDRPQVEHGVLRFSSTDLLTAFLHDAGFVIEQQFGDWNRAPLTDASDEIITVARRA